MNDLQIFNYNNQEFRTIEKNSEVWFIAKDVCQILELTDVSQSVERLDEDEKLIRTLYVSGQERDVWTINEFGLYSLILKSNKPEAKSFKRWITHEVIPAIRKTGSYSIDPNLARTKIIYEFMLPSLKDIKATPKQLADVFLKIESNVIRQSTELPLKNGRKQRELSTERVEIINLLKEKNKPMTTMEIAKELSRDFLNTNHLIWKMNRDKQIKKLQKGFYTTI